MPIKNTSSRLNGKSSPFLSTKGGGLNTYKNGVITKYGLPLLAYSLRPLFRDTFYGAPVVRVQRSLDNTEADFNSAQLQNGELLSFCGGGNGFVATWYDQSGNGNNATAALGSRPIIVSSGVLITQNNKPAVQFTGQSLVFNVISLPATGQYIFSICAPQSTITTSNTTGGIIGKSTSIPDTNISNAIIFGNATNQFTNERLCWYNAIISPFSIRGSAQTTANISAGMYLLDFNFGAYQATPTAIYQNGVNQSLSTSSGGAFISTRYPSQYNYIGATDSTVSVKHSELLIYDTSDIDAPGIRADLNSHYIVY
jgi:hypothetical protein